MRHPRVPLIIKRNVIEAYRIAGRQVSVGAIARCYGVSRASAYHWINGRYLGTVESKALARHHVRPNVRRMVLADLWATGFETDRSNTT